MDEKECDLLRFVLCIPLHRADWNDRERDIRRDPPFLPLWVEMEVLFMKSRKPVFPSVKALTIAAMLTAVSVIIGIFCKNFLNFGNGLFRITFENLPVILSGMLFGPVVGGCVGIATDLLSYLLSSQAYPPNLIVTAGAFLIGFLSGLVSRIRFRHVPTKVTASVLIAHLFGSVIVKSIGLYQFYGILVLWRIPIYFVIAFVEIMLLCILLRRRSIQRLIETL